MSKITIIAEIGINHDGSVEKARSLISEAARVGVTAVKYQYRNLDNAYSESAHEIGDEILSKEINKNYLSPETILELAEYASELGLQNGISYFDTKDILDFGANNSKFDFFKLPSAELTNAPLIDAMLDLGRHLYISTGCHTEAELDAAFSRLPVNGWTPLHCISNYPTSLQNTRLGYLKHMQHTLNRPVGYSSHDDHWEVCAMALQMGASVIERHITLDKNSSGLDHTSSSTPDEFERMCNIARNLDFIQSGDSPRVPNQGELLNRQNLGRAFYAKRDITKNELLKLDDLVYRSPHTGLGQDDIGQYIGKPLIRNINKSEAITKSLFTSPERLGSDVLDIARDKKLALPVRLHDLIEIENQFPIGAFEFHLSFDEVMSNINLDVINKNNSYSVHLPDYVDSTLLMDPFSADDYQRNRSLDVLDKTIDFAENLQDITGRKVPVVGSFSVVHSTLESFYHEYSFLLNNYRKRGVDVMLQWLPPIAWYFGGSITLHAVNQTRDLEYIHKYKLPICMDFCHLLLGRNYYGFDGSDMINQLSQNIGHIHIADSSGIDGEGLPIGEGEPGNISVISEALKFDCLKVIEVWQGHLDHGAGFRKALIKMAELSVE